MLANQTYTTNGFGKGLMKMNTKEAGILDVAKEASTMSIVGNLFALFFLKINKKCFFADIGKK